MNIVKQLVSQGVSIVKDLCLFNEALLGKLSWRFMNEKGNLWRKVVIIKYGEGEFGWFPLFLIALICIVFGIYC